MTESNAFSYIKSSKWKGSKDYELRKKDLIMVRFTLSWDHFNDTKVTRALCQPPFDLLPMGIPFAFSERSVHEWLSNRFIPTNRTNVEKILETLEFQDVPRLVNLLDTTKGLSLTDDYWVVEKDSQLLWEDFNLFDNPFSEVISLIAFVGYGENKGLFSSSPEYTTDGMLRKSWRRIDDKVYLYKAGTEGASNTGREPYSEYYASQIANILELDCVQYDIQMWKGKLVSVCELFTSNEYSLVPAYEVYGDLTLGQILNDEGTPYKIREQLMELLVFDYLIMNQDRHFRNFGWFRSNETGKGVKLAPIYDNGMSLLCYAQEDDFENLDEYLSQKAIGFGRIRGNEIGPVKHMMSDKLYRTVKRLFNFKFERHSLYNLPEDRLKFIEKVIQERARNLFK